MHEKDNVSIKKVTIEIKVVTVGNAKMTKATFEQVPMEYPFCTDFDESMIILGYIRAKKKYCHTTWILWHDSKTLYRYEMKGGGVDYDFVTKNHSQLYIAT